MCCKCHKLLFGSLLGDEDSDDDEEDYGDEDDMDLWRDVCAIQKH